MTYVHTRTQDDLDFIRRNTKLTRSEMCGVLFGIDCARTLTPHLNWTVPIPPDHRSDKASRYKRHRRSQEYGASGGNNSSSSNAAQSTSSASVTSVAPSVQYSEDGPDNAEQLLAGGEVTSAAASHVNPVGLLSAVQITDVHIDPYYVAGTNADCGELRVGSVTTLYNTKNNYHELILAGI